MVATPHQWLEEIKASRVKWRGLLGSPLARFALSTSARELILADVRKWCDYWSLTGAPEGAAAVAGYIAESKAFRTLVYYRLSHSSSTYIKLVLPFLRAIWRPHPSLAFHPDSLGPGCFILHGNASMVGARSIGENFVLGQHVVVGHTTAGEYPTIGYNVTINVGAIVIGDITIGDGATIGAGAVVAKSVPGGTTVVPLPARPVPFPR
jgi:serine O-acetyltransferase